MRLSTIRGSEKSQSTFTTIFILFHASSSILLTPTGRSILSFLKNLNPLSVEAVA